MRVNIVTLFRTFINTYIPIIKFNNIINISSIRTFNATNQMSIRNELSKFIREFSIRSKAIN